ncbi:AEC family transporter [Azorhizobium doebereinerae]|uniref:AEC family transporter n=1 Tax=Azorhizobium doebereinerae TaxID=281091 RepID=UPI0004173A15|nr:AEC family transporter [Azorhizobium doebereinerae]
MFTVMSGALVPVVFLMFLGWLGGWKGYFKREDVNVFAALVMRFALPFSLFLGALNTPPEKLQNLPFILCMLFGFVGTYAIALAVSLLAFRHDLKTSAIQALVCTFPDMAYFGAPILLVVCGPSGFLAVLIGNLITSFIILPLTIVLSRWGEMASGTGDTSVSAILKSSLWRTVTNQMVWLPILGVVLSFSGFQVPGAMKHSVELVASTAGGVSLLALGLMFFGERPSVNLDVVTNVGMKNFLQPALMFLGILMFGVDADFARQALIVGAVPTAIAASMFAVRNQTYAMPASDSVVIGTVLAVFTEALLIAVII